MLDEIHCLRGAEMQDVEIELSPGEAVIAEAGMLMYMDAAIQMETKLGDGSDPDQGLLKEDLDARGNSCFEW